MSAQVVTANRLTDGIVIFFAGGGEWTPSIDAARVAEQEDEIGNLLSEAERSAVAVGTYLIDVEVSHAEEGGLTIVPTSYRERIRAFGPSTHPAFAKKQMDGHFDPSHDVSTVFLNGI